MIGGDVPARPSSVVAVGAALATVGTLRHPFALSVGLLGFGFFVSGVHSGLRRRVGYGVGLLLVAVVESALLGAPVRSSVVATFAALLAADVGSYGVTLGHQFGRGADTVRLEALHLATSLAVGGTGATVAYVAYRVSHAGEPVAGLVLLLFGCVVTVTWLRRGYV